MEIKEELRSATAAFRDAVTKDVRARTTYDTTRRELKDLEQGLFYDGVLNGEIDGKNAETRDAQSLLVFRSQEPWRIARDAALLAEVAYRASQAEQTIASMSLKITVVLANLELGAMGAERLATSVDLAIS